MPHIAQTLAAINQQLATIKDQTQADMQGPAAELKTIQALLFDVATLQDQDAIEIACLPKGNVDGPLFLLHLKAKAINVAVTKQLENLQSLATNTERTIAPSLLADVYSSYCNAVIRCIKKDQSLEPLARDHFIYQFLLDVLLHIPENDNHIATAVLENIPPSQQAIRNQVVAMILSKKIEVAPDQLVGSDQFAGYQDHTLELLTDPDANHIVRKLVASWLMHARPETKIAILSQVVRPELNTDPEFQAELQSLQAQKPERNESFFPPKPRDMNLVDELNYLFLVIRHKVFDDAVDVEMYCNFITRISNLDEILTGLKSGDNNSRAMFLENIMDFSLWEPSEIPVRQYVNLLHIVANADIATSPEHMAQCFSVPAANPNLRGSFQGFLKQNKEPFNAALLRAFAQVNVSDNGHNHLLWILHPKSNLLNHIKNIPHFGDKIIERLQEREADFWDEVSASSDFNGQLSPRQHLDLTLFRGRILMLATSLNLESSAKLSQHTLELMVQKMLHVETTNDQPEILSTALLDLFNAQQTYQDRQKFLIDLIDIMSSYLIDHHQAAFLAPAVRLLQEIFIADKRLLDTIDMDIGKSKASINLVAIALLSGKEQKLAEVYQRSRSVSPASSTESDSSDLSDRSTSPVAFYGHGHFTKPKPRSFKLPPIRGRGQIETVGVALDLLSSRFKSSADIAVLLSQPLSETAAQQVTEHEIPNSVPWKTRN